jgi:thioredoxin-related protein
LQAYNEIKAAGHPFEVLFASSDIDQSEFDSNSKSMPWMKLPYADPKDSNSTAQLLFSKFAVRGIPSLVVLDEAGELCLSIDLFPVTFFRPNNFQQRTR